MSELAPVEVVDCDVHPALRSAAELLEYMPEPWRSREAARKAYGGSQPSHIYPLAGANGVRLDATPPSGGPAGSDPDFARKQLLEGSGVDLAILIPLGARPRANPEHEAAGCTAINSWLADVWLGKHNPDGRWRGTLSICMNDPQLAVREIEHWAGHPYFVQVLARPTAANPLGSPAYHAIYAAAERHRLAVAFHPQRTPGMGLMTPVGFPSYYLETHPALALYQAAHLISFIFQGVFDKFPGLRVAAVEGGMSWFAPFIWRLDRNWRELRSEVPTLRRPPSAYFFEHVRLTTQPWEEPPQPSDLTPYFAWLHLDRTLMFATDYPHHDADDPMWVAQHLPAASKDRILARNAIDFYNLPAELPVRPTSVVNA
jgi:uncharacterized protein